jgi:hypothetical protein
LFLGLRLFSLGILNLLLGRQATAATTATSSHTIADVRRFERRRRLDIVDDGLRCRKLALDLSLGIDRGLTIDQCLVTSEGCMTIRQL